MTKSPVIVSARASDTTDTTSTTSTISTSSTYFPILYSHRSGIESDWRCPRQWYWRYRYLGSGIFSHQVWLDVGTAVHMGLADLLLGYGIDDAVAHGCDWFQEDSGQLERLPSFRFQEQLTLIEVLLRAFYVYSLPSFLEVYEVLFVEQEITNSLVIAHSDYSNGSKNCGVVLKRMSRPDAIVRDRYTGEIATISWKTIDDPTDYRRSFYDNDLQGLMECWASEQFLNDREAAIMAGLLKAQQCGGDREQLKLALDQLVRLRKLLDIEGSVIADYVQTIFLVKGTRVKDLNSTPVDGVPEDVAPGSQTDEYAGQWRQNTFLLYPWFKVATPEAAITTATATATNEPKRGRKIKTQDFDSPLMSWKWRYRKPENKSFSTLGKGYKREIVGLNISVEDYINALHEKRIFPSTLEPDLENPLSNAIVWENPAYRDRGQMERVVRQTATREVKRFYSMTNLPHLKNGQEDYSNPRLFMEKLDDNFDQQLTSCMQPYRCEFRPICFGEVQFNLGELPAGYEIAVPHHDPERVAKVLQDASQDASQDALQEHDETVKDNG